MSQAKGTTPTAPPTGGHPELHTEGSCSAHGIHMCGSGKGCPAWTLMILGLSIRRNWATSHGQLQTRLRSTHAHNIRSIVGSEADSVEVKLLHNSGLGQSHSHSRPLVISHSYSL